MYAVGIAPTAEARAGRRPRGRATPAHARAVGGRPHVHELRRDAGGRPSSLFSSASYHRLRRIKAIVDPTDLIRLQPPDHARVLARRYRGAPTSPGGAAVAFGAWMLIRSRSASSAA